MGQKTGFKKGALLLSASLVLSTILGACSTDKTGSGTAAGGTDEITIMLPNFEAENPPENSPVIQKLEELTKVDVNLQWVPSSSYEDKFNITLASGKLPQIMVVLGKSPSFINAARTGAFWELGPYLKDYPNLSQLNEIITNNASIDGKTYGIYRARALGRNGVTIRKDWLENLGLEEPKTIDEFYNVLKAFTKDDPDGNGKDDTYGLVASKFTGPWDNMQVWFGAPNKWGDDGSGGLIPAHETPEYMEALKFFRQIYSEGLVNKDFAVMDATKLPDPFVNGQAGVMVDVADNAQRMDQKILDKDPNATGRVDVLQAMEGPKGLRDMPTSGYSGLIAISKSSVKTEEDLKKVLSFLDQLNEPELQALLYNGLEGKQYEKKEDYIIPSTDKLALRDLQGLNQILMFVPEDRTLRVQQTPVREKVAQVQKANEEIVIANPGEPLISDVYAQKGPQLDNIINDARIKYIVGQIDEKGFEDAVALWKNNGGDDYVKEVNELYAALK
ncbi:extracellular solute-binding protein [Paenibacillus sp. FSL H7-0942]|uniref:extracellular solute-binding protein n=1 Tax=unclassified Paenibacillus TaxID=185978 RepID=UPI0030EC68B9